MIRPLSFCSSLRARFIISVAVIEIVMLSLLVWTNLSTLRDTQSKQLHTSAGNLSRLFADTAGRFLIEVDYASLEQYAQRVAKQHELDYLSVLDDEGRQVVTVGRKLSELPQADVAVARVVDDVYDVVADVSLGGKIRGKVLMGFSLADMKTVFAKETQRSLALAATAVGLSMVVAFLIGYGLTRRLAALVDSTEQIAKGNYERTLALGGPTEVRRLTSGFNAMMQTIKNRISELQSSEQRFRSLVENSPDCVLLVNLDLRLKHLSPAGLKVFALDRPEQVLNQPLIELFPPISREWVIKGLHAAQAGNVIENTILAYDKRGEEHWMEVIFAPVRDGQNKIVSIIGNLRDVTASRAQAAALEHLSHHDTLTDLPNRSLFVERLEGELGVCSRDSNSVAVLILDLDRFKEVNDTLGHNIGDQLLQQVAFRLQSALRRTDTIARLGGDEFAIMMAAADEQQAIKHAQDIIKALEHPVALTDLDIQISTSIGIALFPNHGRNAATLMQRADVAMYYAKRHKAGFAVYSADIDPHSLRRLSLVGELRHAIDNDELFLQFQPKVSTKGGSTVGIEALVRWRHPHHGGMAPMEFVPLAEETGLIRPMTRWVLDHALQCWSGLREEGLTPTMAINLSVRNLMDPKLAEMISANLRRWDMPARYLELEITESDIMSDPERALRVLRTLNEMGIRLSIDDFGTGYSSLSYLKQLPVQEIKIDKSFVLGMSDDANDATIVDATINLAHKLKLSVVAEGVENQKTINLLEELGCDAMQGFYISRPIDESALLDWMRLNHAAQPNAEAHHLPV